MLVTAADNEFSEDIDADPESDADAVKRRNQVDLYEYLKKYL